MVMTESDILRIELRESKLEIVKLKEKLNDLKLENKALKEEIEILNEKLTTLDKGKAKSTEIQFKQALADLKANLKELPLEDEELDKAILIVRLKNEIQGLNSRIEELETELMKLRSNPILDKRFTKTANELFKYRRAEALFRDNYTCLNCGKGLPEVKLNVHHINWDHYDNRLENLITLCVSCHAKLKRYDPKDQKRFTAIVQNRL